MELQHHGLHLTGDGPEVDEDDEDKRLEEELLRGGSHAALEDSMAARLFPKSLHRLLQELKVRYLQCTAPHSPI